MVLPNLRTRFGPKRLGYSKEEHIDLHAKLILLENNGFVNLLEIKTGDIRIYRMTEELVELVLRS